MTDDGNVRGNYLARILSLHLVSEAIAENSLSLEGNRGGKFYIYMVKTPEPVPTHAFLLHLYSCLKEEAALILLINT